MSKPFRTNRFCDLPLAFRSPHFGGIVALKGQRNLGLRCVWPSFDESYLKEDVFTYSISFNGKSRFTLDFQADATREQIEAAVLAHPNSQKWLEGKSPKKIIVVPKKIVNVVV
jgi:leucyl-tRNA synthetase